MSGGVLQARVLQSIHTKKKKKQASLKTPSQKIISRFCQFIPICGQLRRQKAFPQCILFANKWQSAHGE